MPYVPGNGALWAQRTTDEVPEQFASSAAGLTAAKAQLVTGGALQMPDLGLTLGAGWANIGLWFFDATGRVFISRFHMADGSDPTKRLFWDASAITAGTIHTATLPNYGGFVLLPSSLGSSGQFLRSNGAGVQPSWAAVAVTNALLDGANHTDTVAQAVTRGSLIYGNSTPAWDELVIGAANSVLTSNGTDVAWSANPAVQHDTLAHLKPFAVTNCNWANASTTVTHASGGLANVKVGDFIFLGTNTTAGRQGVRVSVWTDSNTITVDRTNNDGALTNQTFIFQPGDHWDDTVSIDTGAGGGLFLTLGRGTYTQTGGGTFQEIRGPIRWLPHSSGNIVSDFRVQGSAGTVSLSGFAIQEAGAGSLAYFYPGLLTADRVYSFPNLSGQIIVEGATQTLTNKTLDTTNKLAFDGVGTRCVFSTGGGADRMDFDLSNLTALRVSKFDDLTPEGPLLPAYVDRTTGIDAKATGTTTIFTVPAGKSFITTSVVVRCTAATAITVGPSYGIGVAAGEDDIIASAAHATFTAADTFVLQAPRDPAVVATSTQTIKIGIDTAATGTSMALAVDIQGYLV